MSHPRAVTYDRNPVRLDTLLIVFIALFGYGTILRSHRPVLCSNIAGLTFGTVLLFLLRLAFVPSPNSHNPVAISRDRSRVIESIFLTAQEMPRETEGFACGPVEVARRFLTRGDSLPRDFH